MVIGAIIGRTSPRRCASIAVSSVKLYLCLGVVDARESDR